MQVLVFSPKAFVLVWWGIQLFHGLCIVNAIATIEIHRYFIVNDLSSTIDYLGITVFSFFQPVIVANGLLIVCHGFGLFQTILWSIKSREWRFTGRSMTIQDDHRTSLIGNPLATLHGTKSIHPEENVVLDEPHADEPRTKKSLRVVSRICSTVYNQIEKFGVEGCYYEMVFFVLELVEISFQTYQAYKLSGLVSRVWINRLYAIVLILNCWSTVIVHTMMTRNRLVKRVLLLVVDTIFDSITSMGIPFVIIYPYYLQFDFSFGDFPMVNYYDDVWWIQAISENQQVFVTSWLDFISKLSTAFSIFTAIYVLKQYLVVDKAPTKQIVRVLVSCTTNGVNGPRVSIVHDSKASKLRAQPVPSRSAIVPVESVDGTESPNAHDVVEASLHSHPKISWKDCFFVVYGIILLVIHIHATVTAVNSNLSGCLLDVRPWFKTTYTCVAFDLNCARGQFGDGSDMDTMNQLATQLNARGIKSFVVSCCAHFHVPPLLQSLSAVQMIKIYNTTVETWDTDAALRQDHHPDLQVLYVCDTNFSFGELPVGLLSDKFPTRLAAIELSGTNLVGLPSDLHTKWTAIYYLVLERSPNIIEFPEVLARMRIRQLLLCSNSITSIPDDLLADQAFWELHLDGNPLTKLPEKIGTIEGMYALGFSLTRIASLPPWMTTTQYDTTRGSTIVPVYGHVNAYAGSSLVCLNDNSTENAMDYFVVNCSKVLPYMYLVDQERQWRAASTARQERSGHQV